MHNPLFEGASENDRSAIELLHRRDEEASQSQDFATLQTLMSDDPVIMAPDSAPLRGGDVQASMRRQHAGVRSNEIVSYQFCWEEIRVLGDYAFEWGAIEGALRITGAPASEPPSPMRYNVMRILRREGGEWRVHRSIWNNAPPADCYWCP